MAINMSILPDQKLVLNAWAVLAGMKPGNIAYTDHVAYVAANGSANFIGALNSVFAGLTDAQLATAMLTNLHLTGVFTQADGEAYLAMNAADRVGAMIALADALYGYVGADAGVLAAQSSWQNDLDNAYNYSRLTANANATWINAGQVFDLDASTTAAGADVMRLTGDQDARIDLTANSNQVKGLDLDGDGTIETNNVENNNPTALDDSTDFEIVDAYARTPGNTLDRTTNFLGDINFDGTGFGGDGVSTDGNIFLGGLGADTALGGVGNDFLAGGGIAQGRTGTDTLSGGRNADFFFAELSRLDATDGNAVNIDGGVTADDNAAGTTQSAQDADWLLLEASDDDEPVSVVLDDSTVAGDQGDNDDIGSVTTRAGAQVGTLRDIENFDASGNLYGFLNNIAVEMGANGMMVNGENVGIGSSAQLNVSGSGVANIIVGGYDNDTISGNGGNDLLMGGNLRYAQNNPNSADSAIVNDGRDAIYGNAGDDNIVWEADGGIYEGMSDLATDGGDNDTLWLTSQSFGTGTASMATDSTVRLDLGTGHNGGLANFAGYGGADTTYAGLGVTNFTADQTHWASGATRTLVADMESVIATGMGAIDYDTDGTNTGDMAHTSQMNFAAFSGNLTLRGTAGVNTLYASSGNDIIEGRSGDDFLSGGEGNDDFVFSLAAPDGKDVIHRQHDAGNNITDGTFERDFLIGGSTTTGPSTLTVDFGATDLSSADVAVTSFSIKIAGVTFAVTDAAALSAANNAAEVAALVNTTFHAQDAAVSAVAVGNTVVITDTAGRDMSDTVAEGYLVGLVIANGSAQAAATYNAPGTQTSQDRIIFAAYEDRADGELVDDDGMVNSTGDAVTLGADGYAEDLVVRFNADATGTTVLAEDQQWDVTFTNLADEDRVTISVNGTAFSLQMGVAADGTAIAETQDQFVARLRTEINAVADDDTLAGTLVAAGAGSTIELTQGNYNGGQAVFMDRPVVTLTNGSGGEAATVTIANTADSEITLLGFDGRNNLLNAADALFLGGSGMDQGVVTNAANSRAVLETALNAGDTITGSNALVIDSMTDIDTVATDFSLHGDDYLLGGDGDDVITGGTGDDRFQGSKSGVLVGDSIDGGKDLYVVQTITNGVMSEAVETLNTREAELRADTTQAGNANVLAVTLLEQDAWNGAQAGFSDTLVFNQSDFAAATTFYITATSDINRANGGAGTVSVSGNQGITAFTNMEAVRTLAGDGTHAGQGRDTLDVAALSTAARDSAAVDTVAYLASGVAYNMTSGLGWIAVSADRNNNDANSEAIAQFMAVDGVENLIGGGGNDGLTIDETEARKDNNFTGGGEAVVAGSALGDQMMYDHSDMDGSGAADDGDADFENGVVSATAVAMRPSVVVTIEAAAETDTVVMSGGTMLSEAATDTLVDVEVIDLNDAARSATLRDTLNVASIGGATVDFANEQVRSGATVLSTIDEMTELENTVMGSGNDTLIVADAMANYRNNDLEDGGEVTNNNGFLYFGAATLASVEIANQGLYDFNFGTGGADIIDYRNESNQDIAVVIDYTGNDVDRVLVAADIDAAAGNLDDKTTRVDLLHGADIFMAGSGDGGKESAIDLSQHTGSVDVIFTPNVVADENARDIDIRIAGSSITKLFRDDSLTAAERADATANAGQEAYWNRIEGNDLNETMTLTDYVSGHAMTFNLQGGSNVIDYNATTIGTTLNFQNLAGNATTQQLTVSTEDNFGATATHTANGDINSLRVQGSSTGDDMLNLQTINDAVAFTITLNIPEGAGVKGTVATGAWDTNGDGDTTDAGDFMAYTLTVAGYENIAGNDADNTYTLNNFINDVYMGDGDDRLVVANAAELAGDTIVGDMQVDLATTQAAVIGGTLNAASMDDGNDTIAFTGNLTNGAYTFVLGGGTADQFTAGEGSSAAIYGFENVDASGATDSNDTFDLTGATTGGVTSTLRGGAGNDTLTAGASITRTVLDGGAGADTLAFGAFTGVRGEWAFGDSNAASQDTVTGFTSGTDDAWIMVDMANTPANISASFATGATAGRVLTNGVVSAYYDTTATDLLVDMDADGVVDATGDLSIDSANAMAVGDVHFNITGTAANNQITGGGSDDVLRGSGGNDTLNGGRIEAVGELHSFVLTGASENTNSNLVLDFDFGGVGAGVVLTEGTDFADGADADQIGAAIAAADWSAYANVASVTYDAVTNTVGIRFTTAAGNVADTLEDLAVTLTADTADGGNFTIQGVVANTDPVAGTVADFSAQVDSDDTFVFEATAAANGTDTINDFNTGAAADVLDFSAMIVQNGAPTVDFDAAGADIVATTGFVVLGLAGDAVAGAITADLAIAELAGYDAQIAANQKFLFAVDNGTDSAVLYFNDANGDGTADAGEATIVAHLVGVADVTNVIAANVDLLA